MLFDDLFGSLFSFGFWLKSRSSRSGMWILKWPPEINTSVNLVKRECVNIYFVPTIAISFIRSRSWAMAHGLCRTLTLLGSSTFQAEQKREQSRSFFDGPVDVCKSSDKSTDMDDDGEEFPRSKDMNVVN